MHFLSRTPLVQYPSCQAKLAAGQKFCPNCGTPNFAAQTQERYCTGCGTALKSD